MPIEVIVAGMSLIGTLAGTFGGILISSNLTGYRIEQLEKKVAELEGRMLEAEHDIRDMKGSFVYEPESKN